MKNLEDEMYLHLGSIFLVSIEIYIYIFGFMSVV